MKKNAMKMLFVTHKYPPSTGGMENHCFHLFTGIEDKTDVTKMSLPEGSSRLLWLLTLSKRIRRYLKEHPDTTHVYFHDGLSALACRSIKKYSSVKTVVTFHGLDVVYPLGIYQKLMKQNISGNIDAFIPVSTATGLECLKRGAGREKIFVVPNGVDLSMKEIPRDSGFIPVLEKRLGISLAGKKILVSTGRSVVRKGFSWFLNNVLPSLDRDIVYIMAGPRESSRIKLKLISLLPEKLSRLIWLMGVGMDQLNIDRALARPEIRGRAFHLGKLPFSELVQLLKNSYAFVMPNIHVDGDAEGFGLVALEAAVCGTAVLASGIEGITEAIKDGKNGILVEGENPSAWADAVNSLCRDEKKRTRLAESGVVFTEKNFSWEKMCKGYLKVFAGSENNIKKDKTCSVK